MKPILDNGGKSKLYFLNSFRCPCGCNVFRRDSNDSTWYACNACNANYTVNEQL